MDKILAMPSRQLTPRLCPLGHRYYKSTDCPTCPTCEAAKKPAMGFLSLLSAPARRALEGKGITTVAKLSKYSKREILHLHGIGPSAIPVLVKAMKEKGKAFRR
jgi:predicted RecB family nuclease